MSELSGMPLPLTIFAWRHTVILSEQSPEGGIALDASLVGNGIDVPVWLFLEQLAGVGQSLRS